jgi:DDE family transposase
MNSRVCPPYKIKYRVANWAPYDRALVGRGDVTLWVSPEAIATWEPAGVGTRGGQWKYSDVAIETALTLRLLFYLPLRQTEGFLHTLFEVTGIDLSAPAYELFTGIYAFLYAPQL